MKNRFSKWIPTQGIPKSFCLEGLHDDYEGFRVLLRGEDLSSEVLRISFSDPLAYRCLDEGDLLFQGRSDQEVDLGRLGLFTVGSSEYLDWFNRVSQGIHAGKSIEHYAIYSATSCLDVLSSFRPKAEWL